MNTGITAKNRKQIASGLCHLLADSYLLYIKTHNFHWNVTGPMFTGLHTLFEQQYTELALGVDQIAERIRALGEPAPGSYKQFSKLSKLSESDKVPKAEAMLKQLMTDQEAVIATARKIFIETDRAKDEATADLLTQRIQAHERNAWMLRCHTE
ncbi:MAG: Dps family protein [Candidatus Porifericomitaceae bacterium WSBS_2022_MAG_OTU9]